MIYGTGIDLVDVARIKESILRTTSFKTRVFSQAEIAYCEEASSDTVYQRYAARFAAKEAFLKACGTGLRAGYCLNEISVSRDSLGKPSIELSGKSLETFSQTIGAIINLSITHTETLAQAIVIISLQNQSTKTQ